MSFGSADNFSDKPGEALQRNMLGKPMIIDPIRAIGGMVFKNRISGDDTHSATTETGSFGFEIKPIGPGQDSTWGIGPAIAIIPSIF